ncbi:HEPN domain-containing protein [Nocardiopsis sp. NPDC057823]|uniref:HEPN domain-containing protein n=1 Tax=Nocardiopsis sp. NPDC057823 TaxID=3346256 RepID=UPI00366B1390
MIVNSAYEEFKRAIVHCDNMMEIHDALGKGRGRRHREAALTRGSVVLAVAAWQAFVEDLARALWNHQVEQLKSNTGGVYDVASSRWTSDFNKKVGDFSTPSPDNCRNLLKYANFDPWKFWTWEHRGSFGRPGVTVKPHHVAEVMRQWLDVRHKVAHGNKEFDECVVIGSFRVEDLGKIPKNPEIRKLDARSCTSFFKSVAFVSADGASKSIDFEFDYEVPDLILGMHPRWLEGN